MKSIEVSSLDRSKRICTVGSAACGFSLIIIMSFLTLSLFVRYIPARAMAPFLRIAVNTFDLGVLPPLDGTPICAIKMKESVSTGAQFP